MKTYAQISNNTVQYLILPQTWGVDDTNVPPLFLAGDEQPIELRFTPEFVATLVDVTGLEPQPQAGWTYNNGVFAPYTPPPPTDAEIIATNTSKLQQYTQLAAAQKTALTNRVSTLQDAIDLEMATPWEVSELPVRQAQLLEWKRYAVYLGRVTQQAGWALTVDWPVQPLEGMDLTVSATAPEAT